MRLLLPLFIALALNRVLDLLALGDIFTEDFILWCETHVTDLTFHVSKDGLEKFVFLFQN